MEVIKDFAEIIKEHALAANEARFGELEPFLMDAKEEFPTLDFDHIRNQTASYVLSVRRYIDELDSKMRELAEGYRELGLPPLTHGRLIEVLLEKSGHGKLGKQLAAIVDAGKSGTLEFTIPVEDKTVTGGEVNFDPGDIGNVPGTSGLPEGSAFKGDKSYDFDTEYLTDLTLEDLSHRIRVVAGGLGDDVELRTLSNWYCSAKTLERYRQIGLNSTPAPSKWRDLMLNLPSNNKRHVTFFLKSAVRSGIETLGLLRDHDMSNNRLGNINPERAVLLQTAFMKVEPSEPN